MGKIDRKNILTIAIIIMIVFLLIIGTIAIVNNIIINKQMKTAIHAVTIIDETKLYSSKNKGRVMETLDIGTNTYILETITNKKGEKIYKVKTGKKVGYVAASDIGYYTEVEKEKELMVDVSQFNMQNNFKTIGHFKAFLINNNIKYVYIRAGGRGYGQAGNMYYDNNYKDYADACEYLNIPFGFYFLDEAITSTEVDEEVKFIKDFLEENKYTNNKLPVALDVEKHVEKGRADDIWEIRYEFVNELVKKLKRNKIDSILYSNAVLASTYLTGVDAKMWLAYYPGVSSVPDSWDTLSNMEEVSSTQIMDKVISWQFTEKGVTNWIEEKVDISITKTNFYKEDSISKSFLNMGKDVLKIINLESTIKNMNILKLTK